MYLRPHRTLRFESWSLLCHTTTNATLLGAIDQRKKMCHQDFFNTVTFNASDGAKPGAYTRCACPRRTPPPGIAAPRCVWDACSFWASRLPSLVPCVAGGRRKPAPGIAGSAAPAARNPARRSRCRRPRRTPPRAAPGGSTYSACANALRRSCPPISPVFGRKRLPVPPAKYGESSQLTVMF